MMKTLFLVLALAIVGCAARPVPADKLARATAAIRSAEEANADAIPNAALHLKLAREQLAHAKQILHDGDHGRAQYVLLRAEADAEVAHDLAREVAAKLDAEKTLESVRQAKAQLEGPKS